MANEYADLEGTSTMTAGQTRLRTAGVDARDCKVAYSTDLDYIGMECNAYIKDGNLSKVFVLRPTDNNVVYDDGAKIDVADAAKKAKDVAGKEQVLTVKDGTTKYYRNYDPLSKYVAEWRIEYTLAWADTEYNAVLRTTNNGGTVANGGSISTTLTVTGAYELPAEITVKVGENTLTAGTGYTYDPATGALSITGITGPVEITVTGKPITGTTVSITINYTRGSSTESTALPAISKTLADGETAVTLTKTEVLAEVTGMSESAKRIAKLNFTVTSGAESVTGEETADSWTVNGVTEEVVLALKITVGGTAPAAARTAAATASETLASSAAREAPPAARRGLPASSMRISTRTTPSTGKLPRPSWRKASPLDSSFPRI